MSTSLCRWGILGAANIAQKNWQGIRHAPNCTLVGVASRDTARAQQFIDDCQASVPFPAPPRVFGSYEELLASPEIDAVYLPLPTVVRKAWAIRAAEAGKHVLVEKPVGATLDDAREIVAACQRHRVQFMDGVMFMHSRRMAAMRAVLDDRQSLGQLKRISSQFTFGAGEAFFANDIRASHELEPLGCLGDLGWYNLRFTLWAMNWQMPHEVSAHLLAQRGRPDSSRPVSSDLSGELYFADGCSASFYCSFLSELQQWAHLSGTAGSMYIPDFVLPYYGSEVAFEVCKASLEVKVCDFNMEARTRRVTVPEYSHGDASAQESQMFRRFAELALSGWPDPFWGEIALKTQAVSDACLRSAEQGGRRVAVEG